MEFLNKNFGIIVISGLVGVLIGMAIMDLIDKSKESNNNVIQIDTTYNRVKLDSINVQIGKHDTTIYKLNIKLKDDVEKSYMLNDSSAIELFKELAVQSDNIK